MKRFLYPLLTGLALMTVLASAAEPTPIRLWPGRAPGDTKTLPPEGDTTKPGDRLAAGRRVIRIGNVSDPTITVYSPAPAHNTGAAVLVCPGGGYHILAVDIEGTEVCAWLNSIGVTGIILKYRVPAREGRPAYAAPLQDAQRAMGLVRERAGEFGIDPHRIGVLGFSAGGNLAATLSTNFDQRTYPPVDAADRESCRPDFCVLVYAALLDRAGGDALAPQLHVSKHTPPTIVIQTEDDFVGVEAGLYYYRALKQAHVPAEMHLYAVGGHGYGLRRTAETVTTWPDRVADWMKASGWLAPAK